MLTPEIVAANLRSRPSEPLRVLWVRVQGDRENFKKALTDLRGTSPIVPWIVRKRHFFRDAHAVMEDISDVLNDVKSEIEAVETSARQAGGVDLVLLAKTTLERVDTSSQISLPEWFPVEPGSQPTIPIKDLTWSARIPLNDSMLEIDDLQRILYELDCALTDRLHRSGVSSSTSTAQLWRLIRRDKREDFQSALTRIQGQLTRVATPTGYRPNAEDNPTMVALFFTHANKKSPGDLLTTAKALAIALDINGDAVDGNILGTHPSALAAVLNRPPRKNASACDLWAYYLIVAVRNACQLSTAAAHADQYPLFGAELLQSISHDLRSFLDDAVAKLQTPEVGR